MTALPTSPAFTPGRRHQLVPARVLVHSRGYAALFAAGNVGSEAPPLPPAPPLPAIDTEPPHHGCTGLCLQASACDCRAVREARRIGRAWDIERDHPWLLLVYAAVIVGAIVWSVLHPWGVAP